MSELSTWLPQQMPIPPVDGVLQNDGRFYVESLVTYDWGVDYPERKKYAWFQMYHALTRKLAELTMGRKEWFAFQLSPLMEYEAMHDYRPGIRLRLYMELMMAESRNMVIPVWVYDGKGEMREWRCGHCDSPNELKERHCTQCGAPRAKLLQEMEVV